MTFAVPLDADENHDFEGVAVAMFADVPIGLGDVVAGVIVGLCESHDPRPCLNQIVWLVEVEKELSLLLPVLDSELVREGAVSPSRPRSQHRCHPLAPWD